jgi:hypothetical protein
LVRSDVLSTATVENAGGNPMNSAAPITPITPVSAASGTCASMRIHITVKAMATAAPGWSLAQNDMPGKSTTA